MDLAGWNKFKRIENPNLTFFCRVYSFLIFFSITKFSNWNYGKPNYYDEGKDCAELIITPAPVIAGKWNDIDCTKVKRKSICEKNSKQQPDRDDLVFNYLKYVRLIKKN